MHAVTATLSGLELGTALQYQNLAVFPLMGGPADPAEAGYVLLDEALAAGSARVTEVSEGGSVPEVSFANLSDRDVLLMDGEELVGARQNRVLNVTILVAAGKQIRIPVSCVEAGRWAYRSRDFSAAKHKLYMKARALNMERVSDSLREHGTRRSDQGAIWDNIARKMDRMDACSPTVAMEDMYAQKSGDLSGYLDAFTAQPGQRGAVFVINGRVVGAEVFESAAIFSRYFRKLVSSYAMDALDVDQPLPGPVADAAVRRFLDEVERATQEQFPAVGEGTDLRLSGRHLAGGALLVGERVVHLAAFRLEDEEAGGETGKPMVA